TARRPGTHRPVVAVRPRRCGTSYPRRHRRAVLIEPRADPSDRRRRDVQAQVDLGFDRWCGQLALVLTQRLADVPGTVIRVSGWDVVGLLRRADDRGRRGTERP